MAEGAQNRLRTRRQLTGLGVAELASRAGITRQTLTSLEHGRSEPSVGIALRLARALGTSVDVLFGDAADAPGFESPHLCRSAEVSRRALLVRVDGRWVAHGLPDGRLDAMVLPADAVCEEVPGGRPHLEPLRPARAMEATRLVLGCAPTLGLLTGRLAQVADEARFVWLSQSSTRALASVVAGEAHVAGIHLGEDGHDENVAALRRASPTRPMALVTFARWQSGLVVRDEHAAPRSLDEVLDRRLRLVVREPGASAQLLLDRELARRGCDTSSLDGRRVSAAGHLEAAFAVACGAADAAVANAHAALAHGLRFLPWATERFDLVLSAESLTDPGIMRMLDTLSTATFRRELAAVGGHDTAESGRTVVRDAA